MTSALTNALIAVGIMSLIGYALMTRMQNRDRRRSRVSAGADSGGESSSFVGATDGFSLGGWFSSDGSGSPSDSGNCSSSDSGGGGDCGGGGDGGGGGD